MRVFATAVLIASACSTTAAQGWSIDAHAPVPGTATAALGWFPPPPNPATATLPVGPLAPGTLLSVSAASGVYVESSWSPVIQGQIGPLAFGGEFHCQAANHGGTASASIDAYVDLTLRAPTPTAGRLRLRSTPIGSGGAITGAIDVDIGADGTVEYSAAVSGAGELDVPLHVDPSGTVVRLHYHGSAVHVNAIATAAVRLEGEFFPGEPVVEPFDYTGAGTGLFFEQAPGTVSFSLGNPGQTPLLLVFGVQPTNVQLLPTVTQLVSIDWTFATGSMTLPAVPLPSGTALYCQGIVLDANNILRSSRSLRALWP